MPGTKVTQGLPLPFSCCDHCNLTDSFSSSSQSLNLGGCRAPQMALQQCLSTLPCLPLPSGNLQTPFPSIPWCHRPISSSGFHSFLLLSLSLAELSSPRQWILRCGHTICFRFFTMVRRSSSLQLHSGFCCEPPRSSHGLCRKCSVDSYSIKGLDPSLDFCCQGPALTGIKEVEKMSVRISLTLEKKRAKCSCLSIWSSV